jgi:hypothetical protein
MENIAKARKNYHFNRLEYSNGHKYIDDVTDLRQYGWYCPEKCVSRESYSGIFWPHQAFKNYGNNFSGVSLTTLSYEKRRRTKRGIPQTI